MRSISSAFNYYSYPPCPVYLLFFVLLLVELFKVLRDDGDGEGHDEDPRDGAERPNQLTQAYSQSIRGLEKLQTVTE